MKNSSFLNLAQTYVTKLVNSQSNFKLMQKKICLGVVEMRVMNKLIWNLKTWGIGDGTVILWKADNMFVFDGRCKPDIGVWALFRAAKSCPKWEWNFGSSPALPLVLSSIREIATSTVDSPVSSVSGSTLENSKMVKPKKRKENGNQILILWYE